MLQANPLIMLHVFSATLALVVGPFSLLRRRRDRLHRVLGYIWITAMACAAVSSMWIHGFRVIGPFSPIHALSIFTLIMLAYALRAALRRDFIAHGRAMRAIYLQALIIAGVFTFLPGRMMNIAVGAGPSWAVFGGMAVLGAVIFALIWRNGPLRAAVDPRRKVGNVDRT